MDYQILTGKTQVADDAIPETMKIPEPTKRQIRAVRYYFGWKQTDAADHLDVALSTIVDLERGARNPHPATFAKIGLAMLRLGVKFNDDGSVVLPP